jgi:hypothetical protein
MVPILRWAAQISNHHWPLATFAFLANFFYCNNFPPLILILTSWSSPTQPYAGHIWPICYYPNITRLICGRVLHRIRLFLLPMHATGSLDACLPLPTQAYPFFALLLSLLTEAGDWKKTVLIARSEGPASKLLSKAAALRLQMLRRCSQQFSLY